MTQTPDRPPVQRRRLLAAGGTAGALAAAAAVMPSLEGTETALRSGAGAPSDDDGRYQTTQHVLRYYQTARV